MAYDTPYQQKDNSGSIFKNERKEQENHPDGKGSALIDGVEYWVSSWNRTSSSGKQFRSLSFQRKEQPASVPQSGYKKPSQDAARARQLPPQREQYVPPEDTLDIPF
jgi:hypothetical protein